MTRNSIILGVAATLCLASFIFLTYANERVRWLEIKQRDTDYAQNERIAALEGELSRNTLQLRADKQFIEMRFVTPEADKILRKLEGKK